MQRLLVTCLLLASAALCRAQQAPKTDAAAAAAAVPQRAATARLDGAGEQIKSVDEPTMRVFLQIQYARLLWADGAADDSAAKRAETIASDALATLQERGGEMPKLYVNLFRRDLLVMLNLRAPALAARLAERYKVEGTPAEKIETAFAMLDAEGGVGAAVEKARAGLSGGQDPGSMITFFLHRLAQLSPEALASLLPDVLKPEEQRPGTFSLNTLNSLKYFFTREETPAPLRARFAAIVVNAAGAVLAAAADHPQSLLAYNLLRQVMPSISASAPTLYAQASAQLAALGARVPPHPAEATDADDRIRQSSDPLKQTLDEAETAKDPARRESLLTSAAQLALNQGQLKLALDLVMRLEATDDFQVGWRDQFLGQLVERALAGKDDETAAGAAGKIKGARAHAAALRRIGAYFFAAKDVTRAREVFGEIVRLLKGAPDGAGNAAEYLTLVAAFSKIDEQRVPEVAQLAIKSLNNIPTPKAGEEAGGATRREYADTLMIVAPQLVSAFRALARRDAVGAVATAEALQQRPLKAAALFGAYTAQPAAAASASAVQKER